jgi:hypothetical protein
MNMHRLPLTDDTKSLVGRQIILKTGEICSAVGRDWRRDLLRPMTRATLRALIHDLVCVGLRAFPMSRPSTLKSSCRLAWLPSSPARGIYQRVFCIPRPRA